MEKTPMVSVIISTYNRADLLPRAVKSVLAQTSKDLELLIINDASTDKTEAVVKKFQDPRIIYVRHDVCLGAPSARNTGIEKARGEYLAFLDDDDEWMPDKLAKQVVKMKTSPDAVGVIYSGAEVVEENTGMRRNVEPEFKGDIRECFLSRSVVGSVSKVLVKKECFEKAGLFDPELTSCQDWDMWQRISEFYQFEYVPEALVKIYLHKSQISDDLGALIPGRTRMLEKNMDALKDHPDILVDRIKRIGKLHFINGTWSDGAKWFGKAIKIRPLEIFKIFAWCVFELPRVKLFTNVGQFTKYKGK